MSAVQRFVDPKRLRRDIEANAEFGRLETDAGWGRTVLPGTDANRAARERLVDRLSDAGLDVRVDAVGNIVGRYVPPGVDPGIAAVAAGSHLDSVPSGGIFDGPLGVYGALEAVRAIDESDHVPGRPISVVSFTEEEGHRFTDGLLGSSVVAGDLDPNAALSFVDDDGVSLRSALSRIGFCGDDVIDARAWDSWLELHVEQGERLLDAGAAAGIVDSIAGTIRCSVAIEGVADHSGTTRMSGRTDALAAASELVLSTERVAAETGGRTVATVGSLDVDPGAVNVIPGRVELRIDVRDTDYDNMTAIVAAITDELERLETERGVRTTVERSYDIRPTPMSDRCRSALYAGAESAGLEPVSLHSGAGHDTMKIAEATDAGLCFVPSEDGTSHSPDEWTTWDDCADGVRMLAGGIVELAAVDTSIGLRG